MKKEGKMSLRPTKSSPPRYERGLSINLSKSPTLVVVLTVAGLGLFFLFGWLGLGYLSMVRPDVQSFELRVSDLGDGLLFLVSLVALVAFTVTLHEMVHGLLFWFFTGERPSFGWKWLYAYAAAPAWYLPRNLHLMIAAAPLILITLAGMVLLRFVPEAMVPAVLFAAVANAAGSIGDIVVIFLLVFQSRSALVRDTGDGIHIYK